jgi:hypothetical protein
MTAPFDFDRLLGSVLDSGGPYLAPPGLVDISMEQAASFGQRQPLVGRLDRRAWPRAATALAPATSRRLMTLAFVVLLVVAAIAAALLVASTRSPVLLGDGDRALVSDGTRTYLVTAEGAFARTLGDVRLTSRCPTLVAGTSILGRIESRRWKFFDLISRRGLASFSTSYGGFERWSPGATRLALVDFSGRVGIVSFADPAKPETRWFSVPGVLAADWSRDGNRLAMVTNTNSVLTVEVIDILSGKVGTAYSTSPELATDQMNGPYRSVDWSSNGSRVALLTSQTSGGNFKSHLTFVDLSKRHTGPLPEVVPVDPKALPLGPGAWSPDGAWYATPTSISTITTYDDLGDAGATIPTSGPVTDLAWSADGSALAFRDGNRLVVMDRASERLRFIDLDERAALRWLPEGSDLLVAQPSETGIVMERYHGADLSVVSRVAVNSGKATPAPPPAGAGMANDLGPICLQIDASSAAP